MKLGGAISSICVLGVACWAMFQMKYKVVMLEDEARNIESMIQETEESLHMLRAEWTHLTNPDRLKQLSEKYLDLKSVNSSQMIPMQKLLDGQSYDKKALEDLLKTHQIPEKKRKEADA